MENNDLNKEFDVSSLIALCQRQDNLSMIKEIALDQKVSFMFERVLHKYMYNNNKASARFGAYVCLITAEPELYGNYCDRLVNYVPEQDIEEMLMYIRTGIIPYQIMIDKLLEDLRDTTYYNKSSRPGMLTVFLMKVMRCSIKGYIETMRALRAETHLPEDCERVLDFVESRYLEYPQDIKEEYMRAFNTDVEEVRRRFMDNELSLFTETFFSMLKAPLSLEAIGQLERGEIDIFTPIWEEDIFGGMATAGGTQSGGVGTQMTNMPLENQKTGMGSFLEDVLGRRPNELTPNMSNEQNSQPQASEQPQNEPEKKVEEHKITNDSAEGYIVQKVAKDSSSRIVSKRWLPTLAQAEQYKRDMENSSPEMRNNFEFKIVPGAKN